MVRGKKFRIWPKRKENRTSLEVTLLLVFYTCVLPVLSAPRSQFHTLRVSERNRHLHKWKKFKTLTIILLFVLNSKKFYYGTRKRRLRKEEGKGMKRELTWVTYKCQFPIRNGIVHCKHEIRNLKIKKAHKTGCYV